MQNPQIYVSCKTKETLDISDMIDFQGEFKSRTDDDYDMILESIYKHGIAFPFFVWSNEGHKYVLDGHGRAEALRRAAAKGINIPLLPVIYVQADNEQQAKNLLLNLNSRNGIITINGLQEFIEGSEIDLTTISIPELPDLTSQLENLLGNKVEPEINEEINFDAPEFDLYCPVCGELYKISDDELREVITKEVVERGN